MTELTIPAGEAHTISEGETETHSGLNIDGELNIGGQLNLGGEPEVPSHWLDNIPPERGAWILQSYVNFITGLVDYYETTGGFPPCFGESAATNLNSSHAVRRLPDTPPQLPARLQSAQTDRTRPRRSRLPDHL